MITLFKKIWLSIYFRIFVILPGTWIFPFAFLGFIHVKTACALYLILFWLAVIFNG